MKKNTDCGTCEGRQPAVYEVNRPAWILWTLVSTQWRVGMSGPVGLDYGAIEQLARLYEINLTPGVMAKLRALEALVLKKALENSSGKGR